MIRMKEFYTKVLEMDLVMEEENYFAVLVGKTKLVFEKDNNLPFYHLCFRTNDLFFEYMYQKLEEQKVLLPHPDGGFSFYWKGKQAYFTDPDGNILEVLERKSNCKVAQTSLSWHDIGEVGLPVTDVKDTQNLLASYIEDVNHSESDTFAFFGDEAGVFVIVKEGRPWYPTQRKATIHPLKVVVSGNGEGNYIHPKYPYEVKLGKEWELSLPGVQFRIALPTNQLDKVIQFYQEGLGLSKNW